MSCLSFEGYQSRLSMRDKVDERVKVIEARFMQAGEDWSTQESQDRLVFVTQGRVTLNKLGEKKTDVNEREFVFLPANKETFFHASEDVALTIFRIAKRMNLIQYFGVQKRSAKDVEGGFYKLRCNDLLVGYLVQLKMYMDQDLDNYYYQSLKLDELLLSCAWFYSKDQLANLFASQSNLVCEFSNYIFKNGHRYHTISELAKDMNYSVSGFDKKFKRVFGVSGYKWLKKQKAKRVLESIYSNDLSFKQIADNFDFSSESYFYEFCKAEFGKTPGQIRKNKSWDLMLTYE